MPRGDALRLTIKGDGIASDVSWIGGSLTSSFPVELVQMTRPDGDTVQAVVRVTGPGSVPKEGLDLSPSAGGIPIPGADLHKAKIVAVEAADEHSKALAPRSSRWTEHEHRVGRVVGSLVLIGVVAVLCTKIGKR